MRALLAAFTFLVICGMAQAGTSLLDGHFDIPDSPAAENPDFDCGKAVTQLDMNICAMRAYDLTDSEMNDAYRKLMKAYPADQARALKAAQRAWLNFRDKECAQNWLEYKGGSMAGMARTDCLANLTTDRAKQLTLRLQNWQETH